MLDLTSPPPATEATVAPVTASSWLPLRRVALWLLALWLLWWSFAGVQLNLAELARGTPQMVDTLGRMVPPDFSRVTDPAVYDKPVELSTLELLTPLPLESGKASLKAYWWQNTFPQTIVGATLQTIQMALAGTVLALILAFPLAFLGARNTTPHPTVYHAIKLVTNFLRTIPDFAVALVLVAAIGLGPFAGTLALAFHTATVLIKLFAEAIEGIDEGVVEALRATGARYGQVLSFAVVPQVMPAFISFVLYRFETNIRAAAVLGMIGAGGIGFLMVSDFRMFQYQQASMTVLVLIVLVMAVDYMSAQLRKLVT
ncbi:MAG: phosphonate ABC transporter, permease protein PhnE [Candidatus Sericytochromatia bacterium]|nr:phosphonate ABC transporter, permease protein PhnE [Candidatus Sericytochromatia bacterium]